MISEVAARLLPSQSTTDADNLNRCPIGFWYWYKGLWKFRHIILWAKSESVKLSELASNFQRLEVPKWRTSISCDFAINGRFL